MSIAIPNLWPTQMRINILPTKIISKQKWSDCSDELYILGEIWEEITSLYQSNQLNNISILFCRKNNLLILSRSTKFLHFPIKAIFLFWISCDWSLSRRHFRDYDYVIILRQFSISWSSSRFSSIKLINQIALITNISACLMMKSIMEIVQPK